MSERVLYLRVDVDSYAGARQGIPRLLAILERFDVEATFFFSLGPDRWGHALWRVLRQPGFLRKVLRTGGVRTYGLSTCLRGILLPPIRLARHLAPLFRQVREKGHEIGVHCWDHVLWQDKLLSLPQAQIREQIQAAVEEFEAVFGERPRCWASPGWLTTPDALAVLDEFRFAWMSNTRVSSPALPEAGGRVMSTLEIPTTLPTFDETLGRNGVTVANYAQDFLAMAELTDTRVHTIHTEIEGGRYAAVFEDTLSKLIARGWTIRPLGVLADKVLTQRSDLPRLHVTLGRIAGRSSLVTMEANGSDT